MQCAKVKYTLEMSPAVRIHMIWLSLNVFLLAQGDDTIDVTPSRANDSSLCYGQTVTIVLYVLHMYWSNVTQRNIFHAARMHALVYFRAERTPLVCRSMYYLSMKISPVLTS